MILHGRVLVKGGGTKVFVVLAPMPAMTYVKYLSVLSPVFFNFGHFSFHVMKFFQTVIASL